jgi:Ca2+-binding EF-hand superfamily protein
MRLCSVAVVAGFLVAASTASILDTIPDVVEDDEEEEEEEDQLHRHEAYGQGMPDWGDMEGMHGGDIMQMLMQQMGGMDTTAQLEGLFEVLDEDQDGRLNGEELESGLERQLRSYVDRMREAHNAEAFRIMQEYDSDGDGRISLGEFEAADVPRNPLVTREALFEFADDGLGEDEEEQGPDGYLTRLEMATALFPDGSERLAAYQKLVSSAALTAYDTDSDGSLNLDELTRVNLAMMDGREASENDESAAGSSRAGLESDARESASHDLKIYDTIKPDGMLERAELGEFLVPAPAGHAEYAGEELKHLLDKMPDGGYELEHLLEQQNTALFLSIFSHLLQPTSLEGLDGYFYGDEMYEEDGYEPEEYVEA